MFKQKLDEFIKDYCDRTGFSGSLSIRLKDEQIYQKYMGYANKEKGIPFNEKSMFSLYSLSKPFCAIGLMNLYDKGLVDIDAHPSEYLPQTKVLDPSLNLRHIMTHTSGIPDFYLESGFESLSGDKTCVLEHLPDLFERPMYFAPGTNAKYANINYNIMALIIENVSGMNYSDYMKQEIFSKLECPDAVVDAHDVIVPNRVQGYKKTDDGEILPVDRNPFCMLGAGDIVGTIDDVYRLNHAVKHKLLLKESSWKQVLTPSPFNHMGFGCTVKKYEDKTRITHNGGHTGFRTYHIHILEDDFDVVLLSNSGWGIGRTDIETAIYESFYGFDITKGVITPMDTGYI